MKKLFVQILTLWLLAALTGPPAAAQENVPLSFSGRQQTLGVRLGFNRLTMLDRNTSSLLYAGNIPMLGVNYQRQNENGVFHLKLQGGRGGFFAQNHPDRSIRFLEQDVYGHTDTITVPMRGNSTLARLELGYFRKIDAGEHLRWAAGGLVSNETFYQQGFITPGIMNVATVSPAVQMAWNGGGDYYLSVGIAAPIAALVSRSAYHNSVSLPDAGKIEGFFRQGTKVASLGTHQQVKFSAALHHKLGDRWLAGLEYDFRLLKNTYPRPLSIMQHEVGMSFQFF